MARCTSSGRADRDVSGSRSLRTTTYEIPCRASVSARPADGRPAANSRCTESSARMVCRRGQRDRVAHTPRAVAQHLQGLVVAVAPHLGRERRARRPPARGPASGPVLCSSSQSAACVPVLRDRREGARAGSADRSTPATWPPPARRARRRRRPPVCRVRGGRTPAPTRGRGTLPGSGIRPSRCASPSTSGSRISGSSLCTLRSGVPSASRNACT